MTMLYVLHEVISGLAGHWEIDYAQTIRRNNQRKELYTAKMANKEKYHLELRCSDSCASYCFNHGIRYDVDIIGSTPSMLRLHFVPREEFYFQLTEYFIIYDDNNIVREQRVCLSGEGGSLLSSVSFTRPENNCRR